MPEYLAPGVYIEEVPTAGKPIEGVGTVIAAFVGPTRFGPINREPDIITGLAEFERIYGDGGQLHHSDADAMHNYLWHAARAFFIEGGQRLCIARVFCPSGANDDGIARASLAATGGSSALDLRARYPGAAGNFRVRLTVSVAPTGAPPLTAPDPGDDDSMSAIRLTVALLLTDGSALIWEGAPPDPARRAKHAGDALLARFSIEADGHAQASVPLVLAVGDRDSTRFDVLNAMFAAKPALLDALNDAASTDAERSVDVQLAGGNDGARPTAAEYEGSEDPATSLKTGLRSLEAIEEISVIAAPGSTFGFGAGYEADASAIANQIVAHAERMRYRFAVLDSGDGLDLAKVRAMRAGYDSKNAAFYYPWLGVLDPITGQEISLPPSGFVCGIYARNDARGDIAKAPANEAVQLAIGLERQLNDAQQQALNAAGINCFRVLPGDGIRLWGARTVSSDPEWKYVNLRRYFTYLEKSIDRGTQWAVFEPNGEALWAKVRRAVDDFLLNEWRSGALQGDKPDKAFFVRCDRSTMDQNDLDNGRLVCLVGVAPLRPAEFVIFRIGQWTADARCRDCR